MARGHDLWRVARVEGEGEARMSRFTSSPSGHEAVRAERVGMPIVWRPNLLHPSLKLVASSNGLNPLLVEHSVCSELRVLSMRTFLLLGPYSQ